MFAAGDFCLSGTKAQDTLMQAHGSTHALLPLPTLRHQTQLLVS